LFDEHLCLLECVEDFTVEKLVPEPGIEALAIAVLPWGTRFDVFLPLASELGLTAGLGVLIVLAMTMLTSISGNASAMNFRSSIRCPARSAKPATIRFALAPTDEPLPPRQAPSASDHHSGIN